MEGGKLKTAIEAGLQSAMFIDLVTFLCSELKRLNQMQETVTKPAGKSAIHHLYMMFDF